jgi:hypothetical protein
MARQSKSSTVVEAIVEQEPITLESTIATKAEVITDNSEVKVFSPVWKWRIDERVTEFG